MSASFLSRLMLPVRRSAPSAGGAVAVSLATLLFASIVGIAADPPGGTLSTSTTHLTYTAGPFPNSDPGGVGCDVAVGSCDDYALTVDLPADYGTTHPDDTILITISADLPGTDLDLFLLDADGNEVTRSAGSTAEERIVIPAGATGAAIRGRL